MRKTVETEVIREVAVATVESKVKVRADCPRTSDSRGYLGTASHRVVSTNKKAPSVAKVRRGESCTGHIHPATNRVYLVMDWMCLGVEEKNL